MTAGSSGSSSDESSLPEGIDEEDEGVIADAWAEEIRRRRRELRSGVRRAVPWEEAKARLDAL